MASKQREALRAALRRYNEQRLNKSLANTACGSWKVACDRDWGWLTDNVLRAIAPASDSSMLSMLQWQCCQCCQRCYGYGYSKRALAASECSTPLPTQIQLVRTFYRPALERRHHRHQGQRLGRQGLATEKALSQASSAPRHG